MGRQRVIERERRWAVPAAVAAVLSFALYLVSYVIERTAGLYSGPSDAEQLRSLHDHAGAIVSASVVRAIAFLLFPIPLIYLFGAAQARNTRVQAAMIGFVVLGPLLFAAQSVAQGVGAREAASDFVKLAVSRSRSYAAFERRADRAPRMLDKVTIYTGLDKPALEVQLTNGPFYTVTDFGKSDAEKVVTDLPGKLDDADPSVDHETETDADAATRRRAGKRHDRQREHPQDRPGTPVPGDPRARRDDDLRAPSGAAGWPVDPLLRQLRNGPGRIADPDPSGGAPGVLIWTGYLGLLVRRPGPEGTPSGLGGGEAIPGSARGERTRRRRAQIEEVVEGDASEIASAAMCPRKAPDAPAAEKRKRKRRR